MLNLFRRFSAVYYLPEKYNLLIYSNISSGTTLIFHSGIIARSYDDTRNATHATMNDDKIPYFSASPYSRSVRWKMGL